MTDTLLTYVTIPLLLLCSLTLAILQWVHPLVSNPELFLMSFSLLMLMLGVSLGRNWRGKEIDTEIETSFLKHLEREGNFDV